jgi:hypothetical protein
MEMGTASECYSTKTRWSAPHRFTGSVCVCITLHFEGVISETEVCSSCAYCSVTCLALYSQGKTTICQMTAVSEALERMCSVANGSS